MKIEEGKYYRTRDGRKVGPLEKTDWPESLLARNVNGDGTGNRLFFVDSGKHEFRVAALDIVAEWTDEDVKIADVKAEIADEAKRIVTGARRSAYGTPEQNFERIARFWQAYFENTGRGGLNITAADVSPMMRLMKEARLCETPDHRDSFVDLVGYSLTGAEVNGVTPLDKSV